MFDEKSTKIVYNQYQCPVVDVEISTIISGKLTRESEECRAGQIVNQHVPDDHTKDRIYIMSIYDAVRRVRSAMLDLLAEAFRMDIAGICCCCF